MIVAVISTSSPVVSVALFRDGELIGHGEENAPRAASGASLRLLTAALAENDLNLEDVGLFAADLGPGSFTGVKVGVTLAKTLGFALGAQAAGISAFDLIADGPAAIPARKGYYFLRGDAVEIVPESDPRLQAAAGYGAAFPNPTLPDARRAQPLLPLLSPVAPEALLPDYILEPSISQPKVPYKNQMPE